MADITLEQAAERAQQAELILAMWEDQPHQMESCEIAALISLVKSLTGGLASFLIELQAQQERAS